MATRPKAAVTPSGAQARPHPTQPDGARPDGDPPPAPAPAHAAEGARARLLRAGLRLFAERGFATTSTRELAEAAGVNLASIAYYFGDKAGLYKAVFTEPLAPQNAAFAALADGPPPPLADALRDFYRVFLAPLKSGEEARWCVKLRFREILEPTALWQQEVSESFQPMHQHLLALLCRELHLPAPDDDLERLALCLSGLGVQLHVSGEVMDALAPQLIADAAAIDRWVDRLTGYAVAMVENERLERRRSRTSPTTPPDNPPDAPPQAAPSGSTA